MSGMTFTPAPGLVLRTLAKRSFATVATVSDRGRPHVAGVLYALAGDAFWVSTEVGSRKARNVAANGHVAVDVPVRRLPVGPPSNVHFQSTAEVLTADDPLVRELLDAGDLRAITSHGELELPDGCFLRIALPARMHTYGIGMSLLQLARDPLGAGGSVELRSRVAV